MLSLTELLKFFRQRNFHPRKSLGQNFLIDKNIQEKILKSCQLTNDDIVLEIGSGLGQLTQDIARKVKMVYALEKDKLFCAILKERLGHFKNIEIINSDILKFALPLKPCTLNLKLKVIGNLPYYISSSILTYLIENHKAISSIYVTLQKELAERLVAIPGGKDYGAFTIFVNCYTQPSILFPIKKTCFYPPPSVDSCFLKLEILKKPKIAAKDEKLFFEIVRWAFQKRRKTILNALIKSKLGLTKEKLIKILHKAKIESHRRPETLSIEDFICLANATKFEMT